MKFLALILPIVLTGCIQAHHDFPVPNDYDDSAIKAQLLLQEARIAALEAKDAETAMLLSELVNWQGESEAAINVIKMEIELNETHYNAVMGILDGLQSQVSANKIQLLKVCASNEYLMKTPSGIYAVFMVSNNYGTSIGKLNEETLYQTTDGNAVKFKIQAGQVVCQ